MVSRNGWTQQINKLWTGIESVICDAVNCIQGTVWLWERFVVWETLLWERFDCGNGLLFGRLCCGNGLTVEIWNGVKEWLNAVNKQTVKRNWVCYLWRGKWLIGKRLIGKLYRRGSLKLLIDEMFNSESLNCGMVTKWLIGAAGLSVVWGNGRGCLWKCKALTR